MNNFKDGGFKKRGSDFGGRSKFGGGTPSRGRRPVSSSRGGDRDNRSQGKAEMFTATCSTCNKSCEVPFRPNSDKPVYCSACFGKKSSDESRGERGDERNDFRSRNDSRSERPSFSKPQREYQSPQNEPIRVQKDNNLEDIKRQLITIESRLNRILDLINPPTIPVKAVVEEVVVDETLPKKVRKPKTEKVKKVAKKAVKKVVKKAKKK